MKTSLTYAHAYICTRTNVFAQTCTHIFRHTRANTTSIFYLFTSKPVYMCQVYCLLRFFCLAEYFYIVLIIAQIFKLRNARNPVNVKSMYVPSKRKCFVLIVLFYVGYIAVYAVRLGLLQHWWVTAVKQKNYQCSLGDILISPHGPFPDSSLPFPQPSLVQHCLSVPYKPPIYPSVRTRCDVTTPKLVSFRSSNSSGANYFQNYSNDTNIPNVVHYVVFADNGFQFNLLNYLSCVSVSKFIKPRAILIHGNVLPSGYWWKEMLRLVPDVYYVFREKPTSIQGWKLGFIEHASDITRLDVLFSK